MKAITLTQPWASLIAIGAKRIETRSWAPWHTGPLAIHAAKAFPREAQDLCMEQPFHSALHAGGIPSYVYLPRGVVVATCMLVNCIRVEDLTPLIGNPEPSELERAFGNYDSGRWAWILADVVPLTPPVPARGALGLWEWSLPEAG